MLNYITTLIFIIFFASCHSSPSLKNTNAINNNEDSTNRSTKKLNNILHDTTGFLSACKQWNSGRSMGYLQEVEANKDSLGAFCFYECYDCKRTFEIIFIHKNKQGLDNENILWNEFEQGCNNKYANFNCFAFIYPMKDPDKQKDVHAMNVDFPVTISVYERTTEDNWKFLKKFRAKNFHELSDLQFKTIYHL